MELLFIFIYVFIGGVIALVVGDYLVSIGYGNDPVIFVIILCLVCFFWPVFLVIALIGLVKSRMK